MYSTAVCVRWSEPSCIIDRIMNWYNPFGVKFNNTQYITNMYISQPSNSTGIFFSEEIHEHEQGYRSHANFTVKSTGLGESVDPLTGSVKMARNDSSHPRWFGCVLGCFPLLCGRSWSCSSLVELAHSELADSHQIPVLMRPSAFRLWIPQCRSCPSKQHLTDTIIVF